MTECPDEKTLLAYATGNLPESATEEVKKHLDQCPFCAEASEGLALLPDREMPERLRAEVRKTFGPSTPNYLAPLRYAAVLVIILALGAAVYLLIDFRPEDKVLSDSLQSTSPALSEGEPPPSVSEPTTLQFGDSMQLESLATQEQVELEKEESRPQVENRLDISEQASDVAKTKAVPVAADQNRSEKEDLDFVSPEKIETEMDAESVPISEVSATREDTKAAKSPASGYSVLEKVEANVKDQTGITILDSLIQNAAPPTNQQASIEKANFLMQRGRNSEAKKVLRQIDKTPTPAREKAQQLLDSLNAN